MKKHNIDNLFAEKLSNAELTPRTEVWAKLERKAKSTKKAIWLYWGAWAVAASVALLLVGNWYRADVENTVISNQKTIAKVETKKQVLLKNNNTQKLKAVVSIKKEQKKRVGQLEKYKPQPIIIEPQVVENKIQKIENQDIKNELPEIKEIKKIETSIAVVEPETAKEKTIMMQLPEVESVQLLAEDARQSIPKKSRFTRIFKQLKNIKEGEKVEWDEIGINPNRILARADNTNLKNQ